MLIDIGRRMEMLAARDVERRARLVIEDDDIPERRRERRPRVPVRYRSLPSDGSDFRSLQRSIFLSSPF